MEITWNLVFYYLLFFAIAFGLVVGSFLNVVIYRVPAGLSVVKPASRCPSCETPIRWYDNIPVISWIVLRGKCRACGTSISGRYALVEALVGAIAGYLWWQIAGGMRTLPPEIDVELYNLALIFFLRFAFASLLVVIAMVDLDHFIIPHVFTIPGMVLGLASPWILQAVFGLPDYLRIWPPVTPLMSITGFLFGGLGVFLIFYLYLALRGIEGMGGGDLTLMAMVGAWLGPPGVVFIFFAASVQGLLAAGITHLFGIEFIKNSHDILYDGEDPIDDPDDGVSDGRDDPEVSIEDPQQDDPEPKEDVDEHGEGGAAVPFGPFIALAALEYLLFAPYLPEALSLSHLYYLY